MDSSGKSARNRENFRGDSNGGAFDAESPLKIIIAGTPKTGIQEQIEKVSGEVTANRADEKEKRKALKGAVTRQRGQIKATAEAKETEIGEAAEATINKIEDHWNKRYLAKKEALNKTRESRLGYLEQKLAQGRADIAAMPVA